MTTDDELLARCKHVVENSAEYTAAAWDNATAIIALIERHRAEVDALQTDAEDMEAIAEELRADVERLTRERDEARKENQYLRDNECMAIAMYQNAEAVLTMVTRERDEAREDTARVRRLAAEDSTAEQQKRVAAEAALAAERKRCEMLEAVVREFANDDGTRDTVTEHNAFPFFSKLNQRMCVLRDMARAALAGE